MIQDIISFLICTSLLNSLSLLIGQLLGIDATTVHFKIVGFLDKCVAKKPKANPKILNARNFPFFDDLQCKCIAIHILTPFKLYETAQSLAEGVAVYFPDDAKGISLFEYLRKLYHLCNSSSAVFDLMVKSYSNLKMIDAALNMINLAKSHGFMPSVLSYNSVIDAIIRVAVNEYVELAQKLCHDMINYGVSPNVFTYNILTRGFCGNKKLSKGLEFFKEMERKGCVPNVVTYNTLISTYCKLGNIDETFKLMKFMWEKNLELNVIKYNLIINGLCRDGRMKEKVEVLEEMKRKGLLPGEITYNTLVNGFCKEGNFHRALVVRDEMVRNGCLPML
ncbi:unnamed protein product [Fraxinus pennsylvanica]|uniref:Pentatricopeptide repeat-containing protein n=1 Tax=Fraxinus pennsylvanica TaxID=56036 RepID=A0AAD2DUY7_9LAMI|nr:unnamed protein product [Fraxinus pennsylvanica]